jgi:hypothetical protein
VSHRASLQRKSPAAAAPRETAAARAWQPPSHSGHAAAYDLSGVPARSMRDVAQDGVRGSGASLPYRDLIQRSFGRHDVSAIQAHGDSHANAASRVLRASAFALGNHVGFAGSPSLHTAAHEAAHVIQQNSGMSLAGGIGGAHDEHERHADAVADRVVRGQSSEALLNLYAPRGGAPRNALQLKAVDSAYGKFDTVAYHPMNDAAGNGIGCEIWLRFTPGDKVDATNIGLTQVVKPLKEGALDAVNDKEKQAVTAGKGKDFYVDQWAGSANPVYATDTAPAAHPEKMGAWDEGQHVVQKPKGTVGPGDENFSGLGQKGFRRQKKDGTWDMQTAQLSDTPTRPGTIGSKNSGQRFETTALAIEGTQKGSYYGSVEWGWERDAAKKFRLLDFKLVSMGVPSANFGAAARQWNKSTTWNAGVAGAPTIKLPDVEVWVLKADTNAQIDGAEKLLPKNTRVRRIAKGATAADPWTVEIVDGPDTTKRTTLAPSVLKREL